MKKIFLMTMGIMLLLATAQVNAQSRNVSYVSLGPVGGMGGSWVTGMNYDYMRPKYSGDVGISLVYSKNPHWGWGAQLLASDEGYGWKRYTNGYRYDYAVNAEYLRLPLSINYFFCDYKNAVRPKLYVGPSFGLKLYESSNTNLYPSNTEVYYQSSDQFRTFDVGVQAGAGVNIRLYRAVWLNLDAGFYQGFLDAVDMPYESNYNTNQNLKMNVGLLFGL